MNSPTPESQEQAFQRFLKDSGFAFNIPSSMVAPMRIMFNAGVGFAQKEPVGYAYIPKGGKLPVVVDERFKDLPHVFKIYK